MKTKRGDRGGRRGSDLFIVKVVVTTGEQGPLECPSIISICIANISVILSNSWSCVFCIQVVVNSLQVVSEHSI